MISSGNNNIAIKTWINLVEIHCWLLSGEVYLKNILSSQIVDKLYLKENKKKPPYFFLISLLVVVIKNTERER